ncbi:MAG: hypothetical protein WBIAU1_09480 [Wolbachia endosymbiont of Drosophila biauraria]|nr:MAG: hypothetical protein WBIAU1_09480 [Wolbachia endosymbiont of Drosophila biauraria]
MHNLSRKKANSYYSSKFTDTVMQVAPSPVIPVRDTGIPKKDDVIQVSATRMTKKEHWDDSSPTSYRRGIR